MTTQPFYIERVFNTDIESLWRAITEKELMKSWYFKLQEFKAEVGFKFQFSGGPENGIQYLHECEVTEVIPPQKLTYSWSYKGYEGKSFVTFELTKLGEKTKLELTHSELQTFPASNPDFAADNFANGWNYIIHTSLENFITNKSQNVIK